jgi:hypothetical protein
MNNCFRYLSIIASGFLVTIAPALALSHPSNLLAFTQSSPLTQNSLNESVGRGSVAESSVNIAQNPARKKDYFKFKTGANKSCKGQVVQDIICIISSSDTKRGSVQRQAMMWDGATEMAMFVVTLYQLSPNEAGVTYGVSIQMVVGSTESIVPIARARIKKDGHVEIDPKYGEYGLKEASRNMQDYQSEIGMMIKALRTTN